MVKGILMKLTAKTDRRNFMHTFQIKDMENLNRILEGNPVSFANVRHPFERLVSGYLNRRDVVVETFEEFLSELVLKPANSSRSKKTYLEMDPHFRPFNTYCAFCNINYKVISKMETFDEDKKRILELLGLEVVEKRLNIHAGNDIVNLTKQFFQI